MPGWSSEQSPGKYYCNSKPGKSPTRTRILILKSKQQETKLKMPKCERDCSPV
uniref:Uncharacterized protein n=1 Tax=Nelumbo nucifera TaxID=4432 RepID=A0A822Z3K5_NELNU|nr:TPA_asm: hypothetical protein HUJ06_008696 [Nelumbo nucifera]